MMKQALILATASLALTGCVVVADGEGMTVHTFENDPRLETYRVDGLPGWAPFSSVVRAGDTLYVSGHLGRLPGTETIVEGGAGPETTQTMANIAASLELAGAKLDQLTSCTIYLTDMDDYAAMNAAYAEALGAHRPARVTAGIQELALGARVEIACTAYAPDWD